MIFEGKLGKYAKILVRRSLPIHSFEALLLTTECVLLYSPSQPKSPIAPHRVTSVRAAVKFPTLFPGSLFFPLSLSLAPWEGKRRDPDNLPTSSIIVGWSRKFSDFGQRKWQGRSYYNRKKRWFLGCTRKKNTTSPAAPSFHILNNYPSYSCHKSKMISFAVILPTNINFFTVTAHSFLFTWDVFS